MRRLAIFLMLCLTATAAVPLAGPIPSAGLAGSILGPDGAPLAGITIRLGSRDAAVRLTARTGPDGRYRLAGLPPAHDYVLRVEDPAGRLRPAVQDRIALQSGDDRREDFSLVPTIEYWMTLQRQGQPPVVNMAEIGQRTVYDHVFIAGLPIIR